MPHPTKLHLAPTLALPLEAITETIAILGIRGSGKTNTAAVYAEELLAAGQQVVILDPTDAWWGLKSSADGQAPGYPVVILGGKHQDLPLASADGKLIADFVVEERASVVCSLRHFESKAQELAFATAFLRRLYHLKGQQDAPTPLALIIDEASRLVPQRVMGEEAACVGAVQQIVRQGRSSGFGIALIDQRAATVNKDVLSMLEMLVVHRTTGPQDRKALREWIQAHDTEGREQEFLNSIASLKLGEAWVWSPGWLDLFTKAQMRPRRTYDSSRTPRAGEVLVQPKRTADVDLAALRAKLSATIDKARADDPVALRKRIRELEGDLKAAQHLAGPDPAQLQVAVRSAVDQARAQWARDLRQLVRTDLDRLASAIDGVKQTVDRAGAASANAAAALLALDGTLEAEPRTSSPAPIAKYPPAKPTPFVSTRPARATVATDSLAPEGISRPQIRMLEALRSFELLGLDRMAKAHVAVFSDQSSRSSGFRANLSTLSARGLIARVDGDTIRLTDNGRALVGDAAAPASLEELHDAWLAKLSGPQKLMLRLLIDEHPGGIEKDVLAKRSGQSPLSSGYRANLSTLSALGLIVRADGEIVASDLLYPEGLR